LFLQRAHQLAERITALANDEGVKKKKTETYPENKDIRGNRVQTRRGGRDKIEFH